MKIYVLSGFNFDRINWCKESTTHVCKTREEALARLNDIKQDAKRLISDWGEDDDTMLMETEQHRGGHVTSYELGAQFHLEDEKQRREWLNLITEGDDTLTEADIKWACNLRLQFKHEMLISVTIKEIEL